MPISPTSPSSSSLSTLQSSTPALFSSLKPHSHLFPTSSFSYAFNPKKRLSHTRRFRVVAANVTLQSGNGAVAVDATPNTATEKLDSSYYGRQYFPLAAVVGQVYTIHLSLSLQSGNKKNLFFFSTKFAFANRRSIGF
jgi:magnesium chelatase subunit D